MKKLLQFMFYTVYHFYERLSFNEYSEDFAFPFICGWLYSFFIFGIALILNLFKINHFFWEEDPTLKLLTFIPGVIIFIIGWKKLMSNGGYKEWIKPELFPEPMYKGRSGTMLFWGLFFVPVILAIVMGLTLPE